MKIVYFYLFLVMPFTVLCMSDEEDGDAGGAELSEVFTAADYYADDEGDGSRVARSTHIPRRRYRGDVEEGSWSSDEEGSSSLAPSSAALSEARLFRRIEHESREGDRYRPLEPGEMALRGAAALQLHQLGAEFHHHNVLLRDALRVNVFSARQQRTQADALVIIAQALVNSQGHLEDVSLGMYEIATQDCRVNVCFMISAIGGLLAWFYLL